MATSKLVLECPFCAEIQEVDSPDAHHSAYSTKPLAQGYRGTVIKELRNCPNRKCRKPIVLYWYSIADYLREHVYA